MNKLKSLRIILLLFFLLGLSWSVLAENIVNLDLETALDIAFNKDLDYKLATINFEKSKLDYQKRKANYLLQQSRFNQLEMEISLSSAENTYKEAKNQLVNSIINQYSNLWLSSLDLKIKNKSMELEGLRLEETKAQYEIGDIGSIDLLDQENSYKDVQFSLENARDDYHQAVKEFKRILEFEDVQLQLSGLKYNGDWQIKEEEAVDTALKNSLELRIKDDHLELARIDLERAGVSAAELDKKIKEKNVEAAKVEKEKKKEELTTSTREAYYQFKQAVKKIYLNRERLSGAEEKYKLREKQYNAGLITRLEVLEYEVNMLQAEYNYLSAVAGFYQKEQVLKQQLGLQSGVWTYETSSDKR